MNNSKTNFNRIFYFIKSSNEQLYVCEVVISLIDQKAIISQQKQDIKIC